MCFSCSMLSSQGRRKSPCFIRFNQAERSILMRLFCHRKRGRVWTPTGSNRLWNNKGNLQLDEATPSW